MQTPASPAKRGRFGRSALKIGLALVGLSLLAGCNDDGDGEADENPMGSSSTTVVDLAAADGRFTTLVGALQSTGLDAVLSGEGPFTVFAPTDAAFALLPDGALGRMANPEDVLTYHVVQDRLGSTEVVASSFATTVQGGSVSIAVVDGTVVLDGRVQVTQTDIEADNGVIHVLDAVLVPGTFPGTVVDVLAASPRFDALVGAVLSANLATTLAADTFTVFAPTNAAFAGVDLTGLSTMQLADVLTYHAVPGAVDAATVVTLDTATTVEGSDIAIDTTSGVVLNGTANVTYTDILTDGGIVHVIDSVLMP